MCVNISKYLHFLESENSNRFHKFICIVLFSIFIIFFSSQEVKALQEIIKNLLNVQN